MQLLNRNSASEDLTPVAFDRWKALKRDICMLEFFWCIFALPTFGRGVVHWERQLGLVIG